MSMQLNSVNSHFTLKNPSNLFPYEYGCTYKYMFVRKI
jgi:hypothetical protein